MHATVPETLKPRIETLQNMPPLNPADMGHTSSEEVAERMQPLVRTLNHFAHTEKKTDDTKEHLRALHNNSPLHQVTLPLWWAHEGPHGQYIDDELKALGTEPAEDANGDMPWVYPFMGALSRRSRSLDRALNIASVGTAATHEHTTKNGYVRLRQISRGHGAEEFAHGISQIIPQEAAHYALYRGWLTHELSHANRWERWLGTKFIQASWMPVGAKRKEHRADFGNVAVKLYGDSGLDDQVDKMQFNTERLLANGNGLLPKFVVKAVRECVEMYRAEQPQLV